jgi:hypothetical protein
MKSLLFFSMCMVLSNTSFTQVCNTYYFMKSNSTVEQSHFDDKGKLSLKTSYKVNEVKQADNGTEAAVSQKVVDAKGKVISEGNATIRCDGNDLFIDMRLSMPAGPVAPGGELDATSRKAYMAYPNSMKPGDKLENSSFSMQINQGSILQTVELKVLNRNVEKEESITTPAGTWKCMKISFDMDMSTRTAGIRIPFRMKGSEWYAAGFGVVKTESFNKNGKLVGTSEITSIK